MFIPIDEEWERKKYKKKEKDEILRMKVIIVKYEVSTNMSEIINYG